jgi:hypothetical protein
MMRLRLFLIIPGALFLVALFAFEFGLRKGRDLGRSEKNLTETPLKTDEELIELLLVQDLGKRRFAFPAVVAAASGKALKPLESEAKSTQAIVAIIKSAADQALLLMNEEDSPVRGLRRINEASSHFEEILRAIIDADPGFTCTIPKTAEGKEQRSGYPDLRLEHLASKTVAYLEPKLFEATNRDSSLRTFYFETRTRSSKIQDDAHHLLLGFAHDGNDGAWRFTGWDLIDLSHLEVRLKAEFQASNRDLYREATIITSDKE